MTHLYPPVREEKFNLLLKISYFPNSAFFRKGMNNSTQSRTEKKLKQALITDFITRKSRPKSIPAGKFVIFSRYEIEKVFVGMILETLCAEKGDESYWKALAEERQSALNTSLEVNQDLREKFFNKSSEVKILENEKEELIQE